MISDINRIKTSVIWSAVDKIAYSGMQLIINLVLARLILPEEYALVAMISIFIALGQTFVDSGFSLSLIHKQNRTIVDFSTVFYFNIGISIILYLLLYISSPLIANFYHNDVFIPLTRIVALNLIISSFAIVQRAVLTIKTDFRTQAIISLISIVCSGFIGILLAYKGFGVWAMVTQTLLNHFFVAFFLWIVVRWTPLLSFSIYSFKELFSYGSKLLASRLINTICQNLHTVLIGKFYAPQDVAYFSNANQLSLYSSGYLNEIIQRALFPIQCEIQDDLAQSRQFFYRMMRLSSYIIFPIMVTMIVLAKPFVIVVLTSKWEGMIMLMQIIACAYMWYPIMSSNQMFNVLGRTDLYLKTEIIKKIFFVLIVAISLKLGVTIMCVGIIVYNFIEMYVTILLLKKVLPLSFNDIIFNILPSLLLTIGAATITYIVISLIGSMLIKLLLGIIISIFSYIVLSLLFKSQDLSDILKIIKIKKV